MAADDSSLTNALIDAEKRRQERIERDAVAFSLDDFLASDVRTYNSFISPKDALARFPYAPELAVQQLCRELRFDRVQAVCDEGAIFYNNKSYRVKLAVLHSWHWWQQMPQLTDDFWETGYLEIMIPEKVGGLSFKTCGSIRYFGVRFDPARLPNATTVTEQGTAATIKPAGGRPRKDWWDDLWIEMFRRIEAGQLSPQSAADLQRQMEDWLGEKQEYPGDSTLKPMSLKLFKYLRERAGKT